MKNNSEDIELTGSDVNGSEAPVNLLIVDDDEDVLEIQRTFFEMNDTNVVGATTAKDAISACAKNNFDVILTDLIMPEMDGIELLKNLKESNVRSEVIIFTGHGTVETAIEAIKRGAFSYLLKPAKLENVLMEVQKAVKTSRLRHENFLLKYSDADRKPAFFEFTSPRMRECMKELEVGADSDSNILLMGESGVGKEVAANFIHSNSKRGSGAFMKVHCASFSKGVIESELFGHEKGAFTGATYERKGRFEIAKGGTIFLDEISTIPLDTQVKLLRVLQERTIERVGGNKTISVDFRLITASNENLKKLVEEGKFRQDLYYRISVIPVTIPPLREMREDIPGLARFFVRNLCAMTGKVKKEISSGIIAECLTYSWPGNIRELQNVLERAVVLDRDGVIGRDDIPGELIGRSDIPTDGEPLRDTTLKDEMNRLEKDFLEKILAKHKYNVTKTAKILGISRRSLQQKISKYSLKGF